MLKAIIFDWGDTLMRDFRHYSGPMAHWPVVELVPGVAEALSALPGDLLCCAASNAGDSDAALMGAALARAGIRTYFQYLFTSRELGATKPDPRFFTEVACRMGLMPQQCVVVGNDQEKDIHGAKAAGMRTIWLAHAPEADGRSSADVVIRSMAELPRAIEQVKRLLVTRE